MKVITQDSYEQTVVEEVLGVTSDTRRNITGLIEQVRKTVDFDAYAVTGLPYAGKEVGTATFIADDWSADAKAAVVKRKWYRRSPIVAALRAGMTRVTSSVEDRIVARAPESFGASGEIREAIGREVAGFPVLFVGKLMGAVTFRRRQGAFYPSELDFLELTAPALHAAAAATHLRCTCRGSITPREREAIAWVSVGKTSGEIADIMGITERTANAHITLATRKLGAASRSHAACEALRRGYID